MHLKLRLDTIPLQNDVAFNRSVKATVGGGAKLAGDPKRKG